MIDLNTKVICPVCGVETRDTGIKRSLPAMQNYLYPTYDLALGASFGRYSLSYCDGCSLAFNSAFEAGLMSYDAGYTAYISSAAFDGYYDESVDFIANKFHLGNGIAVDIACGRGEFLERICNRFPGMRGLGIDPSIAKDIAPEIENCGFISDFFKREHINERPSLVICRHALDQIERPREFLLSVSDAIRDLGPVPFFIEVGDLEWILKNRSFSDLCYERCSIFSETSLNKVLELSGFAVNGIERSFGGQYLRAFGVIGTTTGRADPVDFESEYIDRISNLIDEYAANEKTLIGSITEKMQHAKDEGDLIAIWGAATKGVIFCNMVDPENGLIDLCIDNNPQKSGCFIPHSGHKIVPPKSLIDEEKTELTVVVMNPQYVDEIKKECARSKRIVTFLDASGTEI